MKKNGSGRRKRRKRRRKTSGKVSAFKNIEGEFADGNVGATAAASKSGSKDKEGEELDQVAGNAEDEVGERIAAIRETELLYGPESLLALYGHRF